MSVNQHDQSHYVRTAGFSAIWHELLNATSKIFGTYSKTAQCMKDQRTTGSLVKSVTDPT
jgi:hypothetical protein